MDLDLDSVEYLGILLAVRYSPLNGPLTQGLPRSAGSLVGEVQLTKRSPPHSALCCICCICCVPLQPHASPCTGCINRCSLDRQCRADDHMKGRLRPREKRRVSMMKPVHVKSPCNTVTASLIGSTCRSRITRSHDDMVLLPEATTY